jgi:preprotein translocase subunit SecA
MKPRVESLVRSQTHLVNRIVADAEKLLEEGKEDEAGVYLLRAVRGLPKHKKLSKLMNEVGVKRLIKRTENDFMRDKRMHEIDEELFYAIDEKGHTIDITEMGRDALSPNDPDMFVLPDLSQRTHEIDNDESLSAEEKVAAREKLDEEYMQKADRLHSIQQLLRAYSLYEKDVEYVVNDGKVIIVDEFTGRLMSGRRYSDGLHQALEAKESVKIEGETQTLATITLQNYFRMYDKLAGMTGTAETESSEFWEIYKLDVVVIPTNRPIVRIDYEDSIYRTRREKYNAVMDEIEEMHRQKRPVLVGTITVDVSETLSRMLKRRGIPHSVLNAKYHQQEAEIIAKAGEPGRVTIATNMAGRGTDIKLGAGVVDRGGLHIIGTERHEARRIDRQLRGRSGRQGDPGSSRFYMSLEDDLMRLFGTDRIANVMDRMGLEEGEVIEHKMVTKSIERAQKRVEGHNFDIRKHLLEYDNVMNQQREVIYDRRNHALRGENLKSEIHEMLEDEVAALVAQYANEEAPADQWDMTGLRFAFQKSFLADWPLSEDDEASLNSIEIQERLEQAALEAYQRKEQALGKEVMRELERIALLRTIDEKWRDHLYEMDQLKDGIGLRAYGQKDPLIEYKREGFKMFEEMLSSLNRDVLQLIFRAQVQRPEYRHLPGWRVPAEMVASHQSATGMGFRGEHRAPQQQKAGKQKPVVVEQKIGRNDPCPCGSGKKYKKCHGKVAA